MGCLADRDREQAVVERHGRRQSVEDGVTEADVLEVRRTVVHPLVTDRPIVDSTFGDPPDPVGTPSDVDDPLADQRLDRAMAAIAVPAA